MRLIRRQRSGQTQPDIPADPREAAALGAAFARDRGSRGVTQQQVADAMGVTVDKVAALEAGTGPVGRREIEEALARYCRAVKHVEGHRRDQRAAEH